MRGSVFMNYIIDKYKICILLIVISMFFPGFIYAQRGCCSHHGGVAGCNSYGRQVCNDGTLSPTCTCEISSIYGCTDRTAKNYNSNANKDDGSCVYYKYGCTNSNSVNYDSSADIDDGSCISIVYGCTDSTAKNYNSSANRDDGSCVYHKSGCTDKDSRNYDSSADIDDGSCIKNIYGCMDEYAENYNKDANISDHSCRYSLLDEENEDDNKINNKNNDGIIYFFSSILGIGSLSYILYNVKKNIVKKHI